MDYRLLRKRFFEIIIRKKWQQNNHDLKDISCVYAMISFDAIIDGYDFDIDYIGSTTMLCSRYRSHKVPDKIQSAKRLNVMYYLPMKKGFYDYEIKLIKALKPLYNYQHK